MKISQYIILVTLVFVLGAMVAGYIYYGMYYAAPVAQIPEPEVIDQTDKTEDEQRREIIKALEQAAPEINEEAKAEIIKNLNAVTNETTSESEALQREEILKALQQTTP